MVPPGQSMRFAVPGLQVIARTGCKREPEQCRARGKRKLGSVDHDLTSAGQCWTLTVIS